MKNLKHSKFKNTGVLFELLVRQVASDTLNNVDSNALPLIKKYFAKSTELAKELNLYQTLVKEQFSKEEKANALIEAVVSARKALNNSILNRQKYALIKEIKTHYVLEDFFKSKVNNYKVLASAYKLFEYSAADSPVEIVNNKYTLIEHITRTASKKTVTPINEMEMFTKQDKEVRLLTYKILVDKFNEKYSDLNEGQKRVLRAYINSITEGTELRDFVITESKDLRKTIIGLRKKVSDTVTTIKLNEVANLLNTFITAKTIKENHLLSLLRYHELVKELNKL
jgi:hypothetical protein